MPLLYYSEKMTLNIKKDVIFSASKENRHYNMYGEKKDPDLRNASRDLLNQVFKIKLPIVYYTCFQLLRKKS